MLNFVKLANDHHIPLTYKGAHTTRGWVQTNCPMCDGSSGFHLGFHLARGSFNCWRCGFLKKLDVVQAMLRLDAHEARNLLKRYDDGKVLRNKRVVTVRKRKIRPPAQAGALGKAHRSYLKTRGFGPAVVERWGLLGTNHLGDAWAWRVVFPMRNAKGVTVAWIGRAIHEETEPRYLVSKDEDCLEDPHSFVYGLDQVEGDSVVVVEGATDVWNMGPGAVGMLGIDWRVGKARKLLDFHNRYILFDPEPAAQRRAEKLASWLSYYPGNTEVITGIEGDPGSLPRSKVDKLRKELL